MTKLEKLTSSRPKRRQPARQCLRKVIIIERFKSEEQLVYLALGSVKTAVLSITYPYCTDGGSNPYRKLDINTQKNRYQLKATE